MLFQVAIVLSAILLFAIQPMMAKAILPSFGGTAGVWVTSMMFFEIVLLAGYFYAYASTRYLPRRTQGVLHLGLALISLVMLPVRPHLDRIGQDPSLSVVLVLAASIGLPFFLLSATTPLFQTWYTGTFPYRLFAVSNAGSLLALVAYPFVIEPLLTTKAQLGSWSIGYAVFVLIAATLSLQRGHQSALVREKHQIQPLLWICLASCSSALWMAVANHLSQQVAPVPFLWVLPLSIYLLSFILCFDERRSFYNRKLFRVLMPVAWLAASYSIATPQSAEITTEIVIFSISLFVWCMFCHGELALSRPEGRRDLTFFYLMLALGGALGGIFVAVVAPNAFSTYLELPISIVAAVILALALLYGIRSKARLLRIGALAAAAFVIATRFEIGAGDVEHLRNFYGSIQVSDQGSGESAYRSLYNGKTLHGVEFLAADRLLQPTTYYGPESGIGKLLSIRMKKHIALVGLGAGTLAAYGRPGDEFDFFEINPEVARIASNDFRFLSSTAAHATVQIGDGRLLLQTKPQGTYDLIVLDAFSDDSIPVHLLTEQAFDLYLRLLKPNGGIAIHLTNRYLDLQPVVNALAAHFHEHVESVHSPADRANQVSPADWAVVSGPRANIKAAGPLWTDNYTSLFGLLRY